MLKEGRWLSHPTRKCQGWNIEAPVSSKIIIGQNVVPSSRPNPVKGFFPTSLFTSLLHSLNVHSNPITTQRKSHFIGCYLQIEPFIHPLVYQQLVHWVHPKAWCSESQLNSILLLDSQRLFKIMLLELQWWENKLYRRACWEGSWRGSQAIADQQHFFLFHL